MVKITNIVPRLNYTIFISFDNGQEGILDVSEYLDKGVFTELRDPDYFMKVKNYGRYIAWPHEQDLCADSIAASIR